MRSAGMMIAGTLVAGGLVVLGLWAWQSAGDIAIEYWGASRPEVVGGSQRGGRRHRRRTGARPRPGRGQAVPPRSV